MGMNVSTYVHHENGTRPFGPDDARRYAREFDVAAAHLLALGKISESDTRITPPSADLTVVEAAVDVWRPVAKVPHTPRKMSLSVSFSSGGARYLVQVRDRSVEPFVPENAYAVCVALRHGSADVDKIEVGALVHVERTRRGFKESSILRVRKKEGARLTLATAAKESMLASEVIYPSPAKGEQVKLLGIAEGMYMSLQIKLP
jgi:hypothetical protein